MRLVVEIDTLEALLEHTHRDRVLRAFFAGKDWDENPEAQLKRQIVLEGHPDLARFPFLVDDEWEVHPGATNLGRGDLVFTDGQGAFAVVEVKFIDLGRTGPTVRAKRTESRGKVIEQARSYAALLKSRHPDLVNEVVPYTFTNERGLERVMSYGEWAAAREPRKGALATVSPGL